MRILLDANVPRVLRNLLPGHDIRTGAEMSWSTLASGILVDAAEQGGFEAIIAADQSFCLQVNINSRSLALIFFRPITGRLFRAAGRLLSWRCNKHGRDRGSVRTSV